LAAVLAVAMARPQGFQRPPRPGGFGGLANPGFAASPCN